MGGSGSPRIGGHATRPRDSRMNGADDPRTNTVKESKRSARARAARTVTMSTEHLPPDDRLEAWQSAYTQTFVACSISRNSDEPFWSRLQSLNVGPVTVGAVAGSAKFCVTAKDVADRDNDGFMVDLVRRGSINATQSGRSNHAEAGDALIFHSRLPSIEYSTAATEVRSILIPDAAVRGRLGETVRFAGCKLEQKVPELRILSSYIDSLDFVGDLDEASVREMVASHIIDLVVGALLRVDRQTANVDPHSIRAARLAAVKRLIDASFTEPAFDIRRASRRLGISERYVQKLFEASGTTFSDYLVERRLEHAREKLLDRSFGAMRIQAIAWASGFSDVSHFNRHFLRRFGERPSDLRGR